VGGGRCRSPGEEWNLAEGEAMTMEERLVKMEQDLARARRFSRRFLTGLGLVVLGGVLVWAVGRSMDRAEAAEKGGGKEIRANRFVLEDAEGKVRAVLGLIDDRPSLIFWDAAGKGRVAVGMGKDGPSLFMTDANGKETLKAP
jgi:hypothetical protein